jgi:putative flippase GtrA
MDSNPSEQPSLLQRFWILIRSGMVGIIATICDLGTLLILMHGFGLHPRIANIPSLIPGLIVMFVGNKYFAFEDRSTQVVKQGSLFLAIELIGFALNALLFDMLVTHTEIHEIIARLLGTNIVYLGFSFPLWSMLVFRHRARAEAAAPGSANRG